MITDIFETYHPLVTFVYFFLVIGLTMFLNHPLVQLLSIVGAGLYALSCEGRKAVLFLLKYCTPMALLTALVNPAFNHEGTTLLLYLPTGNPLTLESILYGLSAGCMLATVFLWFLNFNRVITSDKFIYLFGRIAPALSLILSMTLRFIPHFKQQLHVITEAQSSIGRDISMGSLRQRTKHAFTVLSILITWSLENAIETADSMKSRGYGLKGRTAFSIYRWDERDLKMMTWFGFCGISLLTGCMTSAFGFRYFPNIRYAPINAITIYFYILFAALCLTPAILNRKEKKKWNSILSDL